MHFDPEELVQLIDVSRPLRNFPFVKGDLLLKRPNSIIFEEVHLRLLLPQALIFLLQSSHLLLQQMVLVVTDRKVGDPGMRVLRGCGRGLKGELAFLEARANRL